MVGVVKNYSEKLIIKVVNMIKRLLISEVKEILYTKNFYPLTDLILRYIRWDPTMFMLRLGKLLVNY